MALLTDNLCKMAVVKPYIAALTGFSLSFWQLIIVPIMLVNYFMF